jgi:catechol 2,3-dioxygenase-like lactoylglutathione lyase family enzyme
VDLFAGMPISDLARAQAWYERLLGTAPSFFPNDEEAVWTLDDYRHVYLLQDAERAGGGLVTLIVDDLATRVAAIAQRGIEPALDETYDNGVRKVTYRDEDGNEIGFGGLPDRRA